VASGSSSLAGRVHNGEFSRLRRSGQIIALSIKFGNPEQLQLFFPGRNTFDIQLMPSELYRYSLRALEEAQYLAVPQMRHVQAGHLLPTKRHLADPFRSRSYI